MKFIFENVDSLVELGHLFQSNNKFFGFGYELTDVILKLSDLFKICRIFVLKRLKFEIDTRLIFWDLQDLVFQLLNVFSSFEKSLFFILEFSVQVLDLSFVLYSKVFELLNHIWLEFNLWLVFGYLIFLILDLLSGFLIRGWRNAQQVVQLRLKVGGVVFFKLQGFLEFLFHDFSLSQVLVGLLSLILQHMLFFNQAFNLLVPWSQVSMEIFNLLISIIDESS